ncbi:survival factor 1 [Eremomyces bilateralis CBS 781.70]|uniref:Survival factor 1 n=1 Tax=Eremomyces bilateralis CBS 781.70 TaxID=1392243 RepID=A0A6G1GGV1_9PEZI|nr:survival factor 1 [Eremomyces bilateralis CBS 781.70]KAF1817131.1 survival factor 1 [Eremomyces bilateralis CBS 781.70]
MPLSWSQWGQSVIANVAGTQEPEYGPEAFHSVAKQEGPFRETVKEDFKWEALESTCVETQTFYLLADNGHVAICQVIYSNVMGINTTCQFSSKLFFPKESSPPLWSTEPVTNHSFDDDHYCFKADKCSLDLSEDGTTIHVKSSTSTQVVIDVKLTRLSPGFVVGKDGRSTYGTELDKPWGSMRHAFWPRCSAEGSFITQAHGVIDFKGKGLMIHALQGMKPHHAAARWNFITCVTPTYSAVMMEFTTPPSYGPTVVTVGGIATDGKILMAGANNTVTHLKTKEDGETAWPEPTEVKYEWRGDKISAVMEGELGKRLDRIDVLAHVPTFIKNLAGGVAGTYPYIYQFSPNLPLKITIDGEEKTEEGMVFAESTFIV